MTVRHLARAGHTVYVRMRNHDQEADEAIRAFVTEHKCSLKSLVLDVRDDNLCQKAMEFFITDSSHLDTVVVMQVTDNRVN